MDAWNMEALIRMAEDDSAAPAVSSRLKSRILSALIEMAQAEGPLLGLAENKAAGEKLCVFEKIVAAVPSPDLQARNPCSVCHARLLGEHVERAQIFWPGCPYARFCGH